MLGADFTAQFETNWIPGTGWADEGVGLDFQPAVPNLLAGDQETGRFDDVADYLTRTGGPNELRNVARMTYRMGQSVWGQTSARDWGWTSAQFPDPPSPKRLIV